MQSEQQEILQLPLAYSDHLKHHHDVLVKFCRQHMTVMELLMVAGVERVIKNVPAEESLSTSWEAIMLPFFE